MSILLISCPTIDGDSAESADSRARVKSIVLSLKYILGEFWDYDGRHDSLVCAIENTLCFMAAIKTRLRGILKVKLMLGKLLGVQNYERWRLKEFNESNAALVKLIIEKGRYLADEEVEAAESDGRLKRY